MDFDAIYGAARSLWVVWMMALFIGIVAWVYWPKRKRDLESHGHIPLDDDGEA